MLVPREHGAYGQLLLPIATTLIIGRPTAPALAIAAAAVFVFLIHEELLVLAGGRRLVADVARVKHTLAGEIAAGLILALVAWPIGRAARVSTFASMSCVAAYAAGFSLLTICVRAVIATTRRPPATRERAIGAAVAIVLLALLMAAAGNGVVSIAAVWAAVPTFVAGLALVVRPPSARRLRIVGWALVAATIFSSLVLIVVLG